MRKYWVSFVQFPNDHKSNVIEGAYRYSAYNSDHAIKQAEYTLDSEALYYELKEVHRRIK